jgi:hypothetical protein
MKTAERHHLQENEVALALGHAGDFYSQNKTAILGIVGALLALVVGVGGYTAWNGDRTAKSGQALAEALVIMDARVQPPAPPGTQPAGAPAQAPGTYPTEKAKLEAALPKFVAAADAYPTTSAGRLARFQAASTLVGLGRFDEAVAQYDQLAGGSDVVGRMAALGKAEAQVRSGKYDDAIAAFKTIAEQKDGAVPVDGVLMHLGRTYQLAGKPQDAQKTFSQLVEQHPDSPFATEAKQELDKLKG